jgi:hypothetical protein
MLMYSAVSCNLVPVHADPVFKLVHSDASLSYNLMSFDPWRSDEVKVQTQADKKTTSLIRFYTLQRTLLTIVSSWPLSGVPSDEGSQSIVHAIAAPPPLFCMQHAAHHQPVTTELPHATHIRPHTHHGYRRATRCREDNHRLSHGDILSGRHNSALVLICIKHEVVGVRTATNILNASPTRCCRTGLCDRDLACRIVSSTSKILEC